MSFAAPPLVVWKLTLGTVQGFLAHQKYPPPRTLGKLAFLISDAPL